MKISELAGQAKVSVQTVRYYERRNLLDDPRAKQLGYREYGDQDLRRLRFILRAKGLGFTLSEIRELLGLRASSGKSADDVRRRAHDKIADVDRKLEDLQRIRVALGRVVNACDAHGPIDSCTLIHALEGEEAARN